MKTTKDYRDFIENYLVEHFIGPGYSREIYECCEDASDEVIDQPARTLYSSGILKPKQSGSTLEKEDYVEEDVLENEDDDIDDNLDESHEKDERVTPQDENIVPEVDNPFESHCGLIACVSNEEKAVEIIVRYGKYDLIDANNRHQVKLRLGHLYSEMRNLVDSYNKNPQILEELKMQKNARSSFGEYFIWNEVQQTLSLDSIKSGEPSLKSIINEKKLREVSRDIRGQFENARFLLNRLMYARLKRRKQYEWTTTCSLSVSSHRIELSGEDAILHLYTYKKTNDCQYLKVLLENKAENVQTKDGKDLCQVEIILKPCSGNLVNYRDPFVDRSDNEQGQIEYLYREVKDYGKGVGCGVVWDEHASWIKTTFAPSVDIKKSANSLDADYCKMLNTQTGSDEFNEQDLNDCCKLFNLSHWTEYETTEYINRLDTFVKAYARWCKLQKDRSSKEGEGTEVARELLEKQNELLDRLEDNIDLLRNDERALKYFQYANTAMLIQMIVARDKNFAKNRDRSDIEANADVLNNLDYFRQNASGYAYRPFQLAFLLMNVRSTVSADCAYRTDGVDLIWFPTGGGKTEAYLALTALTIIYRRCYEEQQDGVVPGGVAVVMRYTLRLLTAQQFERASYLICALEFMRNQRISDLNLGNEPITIGLWVGSSVTPNRVIELSENSSKYRRFREKPDGSENPYPISCCPWCGSQLIPRENNNHVCGYGDDGRTTCINSDCYYSKDNEGRSKSERVLPIKFVDEKIYEEPPTLLFATVDKFANIHKHPDLLGVGKGTLSPNLIVQDELHLISGPLGSMVGFFESAVQYLMTRQEGRIPKIVASTATTRNTDSLIQKLYKRKVHIFPAHGITYDDNFFSHIETGSLRRHLALSTQVSTVKGEVRIFAHLLLARLALMKVYLLEHGVDLSNTQEVINSLLSEGNLKDALDNYWSVVAYYTSLKEVGRMRSRITQEIRLTMGSGKRYMNLPQALDFLWKNITGLRIEEFTGRIDSLKVKGLLSKVERKARFTENLNPQDSPDIILATNMISVGIDISRWNILLMSSLPNSVAEYIQSTSRVARSVEGLVVNLVNRKSSRSLSIYENYIGFHRSYYKYVEPLSITPATRSLIQHDILSNIYECVRKGMPEDVQEEDVISEVCNHLGQYFSLSEEEQNFIAEELEGREIGKDSCANSLRDIEGNIGVCIQQVNY